MEKHTVWTSEEHETLVKLLKQYPDKTYQFIADKLIEIYGSYFTSESIRKRMERVRKKSINETPVLNYKETVEINHDGTHKSDKLLRMSAEQSKDVDFLLDAHGYDKDKWDLISARNNIWNVYSKQDGIQTLYSSKIVVKPKQNDFSIEDIKEFFFDLSKHYQSPRHKPIRYSSDGKLLELNIADLHLGKLSWRGDSGEQYDHEIAKERFFYIINDVLTRTKGYKLEKILFVWSNDFFHYDTINSTTTAGTRQDTNLRWQNLYKIGVQMLVEAIDLLSQYAPMETFYIGSNHDKMTSYFATEYLNAWFRNNPNVKVDVDPKTRKHVQFGKCLIGFTHGHAEKNRIGKWLQVEAAKEWGETLYREVHAGHIHSEKLINEDNGVLIRHVSSPTGTDNWHYESGYIGAIKKAQSFLWDRENGLEMIINTPIKEFSKVV